MPQTVGRLLRGDFVHHGFLLLLATVLVNLSNYGFHFVASRGLGPVQYGDLYALITALGVLGVISISATTAIVRLTAEMAAADDPAVIAALLRAARRWSIVAAGIVGAAVLAARPAIASFLNLGHSTAILPWAVVVFGNIIVPPLRGVLQGVQDFRGFAISTATEAIGRVCFGSAAVLLGFGVAGALAGQALGMLAAWIYTELRLRRTVPAHERRALHMSMRRFAAVVGGVVGSTLATTALLSIDALLAKHYLTPHDAGLYSALSLGGKVLMFAVGFVPMILLPKATQAATRQQPLAPILIAGSLTSLVITAATLALYAIVPSFVLRVMVGPSFQAVAPLLLPYGIGMALLATTNTIVAFKIAIHRFEFIAPLMVTAVAEACAIALYHNGISQIIAVLIAAQAVALAVCAVPWSARERQALIRLASSATN